MHGVDRAKNSGNNSGINPYDPQPVNFPSKTLMISKIALAVFIGMVTTVSLIAAGITAPIALIGGAAVGILVYAIASRIIGKKNLQPVDVLVQPSNQEDKEKGASNGIPNAANPSQIIEGTDERPFPMLSKVQVEELSNRAFKDYINEQPITISPQDQAAILNYWCTENRLDDIKGRPTSFDYLHCAQPNSATEHLIKKYFEYLGTNANRISEVDRLAFLLSPFLASHPSTVFEEAILFFNLKALLQKEGGGASEEAFKIEVLNQITRQIYPNPAEQDTFIGKILKPKDLDFRFFQELQESVALFVGARFPHYITNLITQNWTRVLNSEDTTKWWFADIIKPQIETIMHSLNGESLPVKVEKIKSQIVEIKPVADRVSLLYRVFSYHPNPQKELIKKSSYFTETLVDFNSDLSTVYQLFKGRGKDAVDRQALHLIHERVWSTSASSYDYILKLLLIQWFEYDEKTKKTQECNLTIPFQIILYCHLQDKAKVNNFDEQDQKLLNQIEVNANNWKEPNYLQILLHQLNNKAKIDYNILYLAEKSQMQLNREQRRYKDSDDKLEVINTLKKVLKGVDLETDKQTIIDQLNNYFSCFFSRVKKASQ